MEETRQNQESLSSGNGPDEKNRGHLKIFFGYAVGVGKTFAMLQAARTAQDRGIDVVIGCVNCHGNSQMAGTLQEFEQIPEKNGNQSVVSIEEYSNPELNLDAVMKRNPSLVLVDELAQVNKDGSRHARRYQDVEELLKAGIDVYTTLNVQQIESLNDIVTEVTGRTENQRIPDAIFDNADQVQLVDIEPEELLERLRIEEQYENEIIGENPLFSVDELTVFRELALRRCADRLNVLSENARLRHGGDYHTDEHILVCLSLSPSNMKIIRTAARMAKAFRGSFTALFVETSASDQMGEENKKRLRNNMRLAEQLGAKIETVYGEDVPFQIAEFARLSGVSKIVIGKSTFSGKLPVGKLTLTDKLIAQAQNIDIHIILDSDSAVSYRMKNKKKFSITFNWKDVVKSIIMLIIATILAFGFWKLGLSESNIIMIYILGVLITAVITTHQIYSLIASVVSVIIFNFLYTEPRFSLLAYDKDYPLTFLIMFLAAFLTGTLAVQLKRQAKQSARAAYRTKIMFDTNHLLEKVREKSQIVEVTATQLMKLLNRDMIIYLVEKDRLQEPHFFSVTGEKSGEGYMTESERNVADWVFHNNKHAGATTETFSNAECLYLSIRTNEGVYGIVGIVLDGNPLDAFENSVLLSILGECALALENEKNAREKAEAALMAEKEQLRANLLRSISHDLRTPLTSISGNASNLLANEGHFDEKTKKQLYSDIYDDSMWLYNLVENLLSVTKIEEGRFQLHLSTELLDEVITESLRHINRKKTEHHIIVRPSEEFLLIKADARLIMQVIINLIDNAIKYTQKDSEILITTRKEKNQAVVCIADNGPGISDEMKPYIFDMFYSGAKSIADSRRSLGLGLALCKSIIQAHGGVLKVTDNVPHGAVFTFSLPLEEVDLHE